MNKRFYHGVISLTMISLFLGFMISMQMKSVDRNNAVQSMDNLRADELQVLLNKEREKTDSLGQQLAEYKSQLDTFRSEAAQSGDYAELLNSQLEKAEILAGIKAVEGPGVTITLEDNRMGSSDNVNNDVIHDDDILQVINALCEAGAEAISLNDERLLATSEIRCAGSTVSVNNNRYAAPFTIKAIGDPKNLEAALLMRHGIVEVLESWGIGVKVVKSNLVAVNGYQGSVDFKYATPVK